MPSARYVTVDVFTDRRFGGNQLAVFPDAREIPGELMLDITKEFNYSETTFVLPPEDPRHTRRVRIFTPEREMPFAGHPTVGTAHVLAHLGEVMLDGPETRIVFEEGVGPVPVTIREQGGRPVFAQLTAAKLPEVLPPPPPATALAEVLSLHAGDILQNAYKPEAVSAGLPFLFVPVTDRRAVARARVRMDAWERVLTGYPTRELFVFAFDPERDGSDVRARMFAPGLNVFEDPATGSACAALGGYLGMRDQRRDGTLRWIVEQGFEMGRPSILEVETEKAAGAIAAVRVGGSSVVVCEGILNF
ncbi:MAG: PhzF family phenazine biosynthesis protein [Gemmatimonadota bacterium]|nr:PhzF family phenazine biosynthesis protein [Gemmatimonadota bacterium]